MNGAGLFYLLVLSCVHLDYVSGSLASFFEDLPGKISDALSYTWNNIVEAIKKPVRIKRLGKLGQLKTTSTAPTTKNAMVEISLAAEEQMENEYGRINVHLNTIESNTDVPRRTLQFKFLTTRKPSYTTEMMPLKAALTQNDVVGLKNAYRGSSLSKLTIPHLRPPQWTNLEDWRKLQRPIYGAYNEEGRRDYRMKFPMTRREYGELFPTTYSHHHQQKKAATELGIAITDGIYPIIETLEPIKVLKSSKLYLPVISTQRNKYSRSYMITKRESRVTEISEYSLPKVTLRASTASTDKSVKSTTEPYLKLSWNVQGSKIRFKYNWYVNAI